MRSSGPRPFQGPTRLVIAALVLWACGSPPRSADLVLLVSIDTLRADAAPWHPDQLASLSAKGTDAAWRRLVEESRIWERAISPASWTLPAHASLLSGALPDIHGATDVRTAIDPTLPLLPEILRGAGFETVAFVGGGFVGSAHGLDRGFERFDDSSTSPSLGEDPVLRALEPLRRAARFLRDRPPSGGPPRFVFVHTYAVHDYFRTGEGDDEREERALRCLVGRETCQLAEWEELEARYRDAVHRVSEELLATISELRQRGELDRAILVVTSDHGEGFQPETGRMSHGGRLHPDVLRIPLAIRAPGLSPDRSTDVVSLLDVAPTVLDLLGIPVPSSFEGNSLAGPNLSSSREIEGIQAMEHGFYWSEGTRYLVPEVRELPLASALVRPDAWAIVSRDGGQIEDAFHSGDLVRIPELSSSEARAWGLRRSRARPETPRVEGEDRLFEDLKALGYLE